MSRGIEKINDTLSNFDVKWNKPYYVSKGSSLSNFSKKLFRIDYFVFCLCTKGQLKIKVDKEDIYLEKGKILITAPPSLIGVSEISPDLEVRVLLFEKKFLLKHIADSFLLDKILSPDNEGFRLVKISKADEQKIVRLLDHISKKDSQQSKYKEEIIRSSIFILLLETAESMANQAIPKTPKSREKASPVFFKFLDLVKANVVEHRDVHFYLEQLHITNRNLIMAVKKACGQTPHQIIANALVEEAIVMMNKPDTNISEISFSLNFNSVSEFSRFFKKMTNISPSDFRSSNTY